jgi:DNA-binding MarR family transcriptional regulator
MNDDEESLSTAAAVRRGVMGLGRRLKLERPASASLTSLELSVLGHLHRDGPMTPGELAAAERVQPQTLTRTLTSLTDRQFVSRQGHPQDGRRAVLGLTEAGLGALRADMTQRDSWLAAAMAEGLTRAERELLRLAAELMDQLAASGQDAAGGQDAASSRDAARGGEPPLAAPSGDRP